MGRPSRSFPWLPAGLALTAGLVVVTGVLGIGRALQTARLTASLEKRRAASMTATAVRQVSMDARLLEFCEAGERFEVLSDSITIEGLPAPRSVQHPAVLWVADEVRSARESEFTGGDVESARASLLAASLRSGLPQPLVARLRLELAWLEHRGAEPARAAEAFGQVAVAELSDADVASWCWLSSHQDLSAEAQRDAATHAFARLANVDERTRQQLAWLAGSREVDDGFRARCEAAFAFSGRVAATRRVLALRSDAALTKATVVVEAVGAAVLVFHPTQPLNAEASGYRDGHGAVFTLERFAAVLEATTAPRGTDAEARTPILEIAWSGRLAEAPAPGSDAKKGHVDEEPVLVVPGLAILPEGTAATSGFEDPRLIPILLAVLVAVFASLLLAFVRTHRRERAALELRSDFLRSVSHELRTPLTSIRMLAESLEGGTVPKERSASYLGLMAGEATRLGALVENVLDLGRIERGERRYDLAPLRLDEVVHEVIALTKPLATRHGGAIEGRLTPLVVLGDADALRQTLLNLIDNAIKYASKPEAGPRILVTLDRGPDGATLAIEDDGPGVPAEERELVFEQFRRGAAHADASIAGTGIGLGIARSIAVAHGGDLRCSRAQQLGGARFDLRLPLAEPEDTQLRSKEDRGSQAEARV